MHGYPQSIGRWIYILLFLFCLPARCPAAAIAAVAVTTYHGDSMRTGWNRHEAMLTPASVASSSFGKLWSAPVDGQVYAQPLLMPGVNLGAAGTRDLVFVATEHDSVYAFDADNGGPPIWQTSLGPSVPSDARGVPCPDIAGPEYGITGTPVVDTESSTLYIVAKTLEGTQQHYRLHALLLASGRERAGWPVEIRGMIAGSGGGSVNGIITFDAAIQNQRAGLLLLNGRVIIAFAGHCDDPLNRYHGWLFSYNTADPSQPPAIYNTTPDAGPPPNEAAGGIWQSGCAPAVDDRGNIYFETGNGQFNADQGGRDVGDSFVRLTTEGGGLTFIPGPANYYTPDNQQSLDAGDLDVGAGGAMVIPDQAGTATPRLLVGSGKDGILRLLNRDMLGGYASAFDEKAVQVTPSQGPWPLGAVFGVPAYWESPTGHYLFYTSTTNPLRRLRLTLNPAKGNTSWLALEAQSRDVFGIAPTSAPEESTPTPVVTSNGLISGTGIVWLLSRIDNTLRAYDADDLRLLWASDHALDGSVLKFTVPIVANGKVYAGTKSSINCFGLH